MNDDMGFKIACECAKIQLKMREEFINDFMKYIQFRVDSPEFEEAMTETIKTIIKTAYNKGAADALRISEVVNMEGGEDDD